MDVPVTPHGHDRLAYLLRLLRPAPVRWITRAQQIAFESTALTDRHLAELEWKLESDSRFRYRAMLEADPLTALHAEGMPASTAEPLLRALAVGDEATAKLPEVVAHDYEPLPQAARLRILLLGSTAVVDAIRARADSL
jgi:hypothetical protein